MHDAPEGIAIIGMAGRFPGAKSIDEFWQNLWNGVESIAFFSDEELRASGIDPVLLGDPNYVKAYGVLEGVELFDASLFGLRPREAEIMDPQHRLFLECAWEALESAGYDSARYDGAIGVYAGVGVDTYALVNLLPNPDLLQSVGALQTSIRNRTDHLTTHVSYKLNLRGPGVTVQTACSTSLVAVHLACQSLLNGECDIALAGGVSIAVPQKAGYVYQEGGILAPDGHCRAFDARAQGCVGGSGVGIVVLKRLEEALADGDCIHAVIKGSAINNDGSVKVGYTAPGVDGQAEVIAEALALAGVDPETVTYIEAHGTGTALGDPIEIAALTRAFRASTEKKGFCALGAVKTNIGHLDTAAGVAGLIKTALALKHKRLPPSLHFERPNPRIDFESSPFYVNTRLAEWKAGDTPRRAGVSSFGLGGTNAHLVLEEAPAVDASGTSRPWQLLLLSAKTSLALESATARLAAYLEQHPEGNLADVAYTLQVGRKVFGHRRAIVCQDGSAVTALEALDPARVYTGVQEPKARPVVFMFPGQGAQYVHMGSELYRVEPTFREQIDLCSELLEPHLGLDLRSVLYPGQAQGEEAADTLKQTYLTQTALFVVEYALARLWMEWGVRPEAMIGHSIGEYVAACLAGVFSLEDALALVAARGRLMQSLPGGAMLAVRVAEKDVQPLLGERLSLAASNGPTLCVVSGPTEAVEALAQQLTTQGMGCRRLHTSHAFHSQMMDPILERFTEEVKRVTLKSPQIPFVSNVTGTWIRAAEGTDPGYWARHLRQTVRFAEGVHELVQDPDWVLLEVGPGQTLLTIARWHPRRAAGQVVLTSMRPVDYQESDVAFLLTTLGRLWLAGVQVDWGGYYAHERRRRLVLPTYPFERQRYWIEPPQREDDARIGRGTLRRRPNIADWFYAPSWKRSTPIPFAPGALADQKLCWLVFVDACGLGSHMLNRLEQLGQDVMTVVVGEGFRELGERGYTINPRRGEDYVALLKALRARDKTPVRIVHFWGITPSAETPSGTEGFEQSLERGFYSLLFLAQALGTENLTEPLHIGVVTTNVQEVLGEELLYPEKATVIGPCRAIPKEYPNVTCRSIDIALPQAGSRHEEKLVDQLIAELTAPSSDVVIAYRGQHRWVQVFEPVHLDGHTGRPPRLRNGGVYLITGGLGGIGLALAEYLARTVQAKLILTGRSAFPVGEEWGEWLVTHDDQDEVSRKIRKVQALEQLGAEVLILSADVANEKQMRAVIVRACERFGQIHGVIHAAGLAGGGMMQLKTPETAASVLAPKVKGTRVLDALCKDMQLDFLALCSSRTSILGGFGQVDYCAANAFLDAFAHYKTSRDNTFTVSINWGAWQEVGMRVNTLVQLGLKASNPTSSYQAIAHPLLEKCIHETPAQEIYVTEFSVAKHWVLDDHRIVKKAVIPGVAYLEMARAALEKHAGNRAIEIRDVFFLTPVGVRDDETREIRTVLKKDGDGFSFRMLSKSASEDGEYSQWQECAFGKAGFIAVDQPKKYEIKDIIERCNEKEIIATDEPMTHEDLGPRWQNLKRAYVGKNELLTLLELSEDFTNDLEKFKLHPALLDRTNGAAKTYLTGRGFYMPMSYKSLRIKAPLPRKIYAYHQYKEDKDPSNETITFDVVLMDEDGIELVDIEEFSQKKVNVVTGPIKALAGHTYRQESQETIAGMGEQQGKPVGEGAETDIYQVIGEGISTQEGVEAFSRILSSAVSPQIVVSPRDLQIAVQQANAATPQHFAQGIAQLQLARPSHPRPDVPTAFVPPRSELERRLAEIWQDALGIEQIGIHDNFFELGGDSVVGIQMIAKSNRAGFQLTPQQLFQYQTIAGLAAVLELTQVPRTEADVVPGPVPLTPLQRCFLEQNMPVPHHFNQAIRLDVRQALAPSLQAAVMQQLLMRHEALCLRFEPKESGWQQVNASPDESVSLTRVDLSMVSEAEQEGAIEAVTADVQASLHLSQGPLVRVVFFDLGPARSDQLLIVIHALVVDGVSWRVLLTDLATAWQQLSHGEAVLLRPKTASFTQWAQRLTEHAQSVALQQELTYWLAEPREQVSHLPVDFPGGAHTEASARTVSVSLGIEETRALLQEVPKAYQTQTDEVLLTALVQTFMQWTGERYVLVDLEGHGREAIGKDIDLSHTVGAFSALFPMLLEVGEEEGPGDLLRSVKEQLRRIPHTGIGYGLLRYLRGNVEIVEKLRALPQAEVQFTYLSPLDQILPASSPFGLVRQAVGPVHSLRGSRSYVLEVNAFVTEGQLHLDWIYSESVHRRGTVEHLAQVFMQALRSLIAHCQSPVAGGYTPSDFPLADIDQRQLDKIMARFNRAQR